MDLLSYIQSILYQETSIDYVYARFISVICCMLRMKLFAIGMP